MRESRTALVIRGHRKIKNLLSKYPKIVVLYISNNNLLIIFGNLLRTSSDYIHLSQLFRSFDPLHIITMCRGFRFINYSRKFHGTLSLA